MFTYRFTIGFKKEVDAAAFEAYWPGRGRDPQTTDDLRLTEDGWPPSDEWTNTDRGRQANVFQGVGDCDVSPDVLWPALQQVAAAVALHIHESYSGETAWECQVEGEEANPLQVIEAAIRWKVESSLLLALAIGMANADAVEKLLAGGADPNVPLVHLCNPGFSAAGPECVLPLDAMASELEGLSGEYAEAPLAIVEHLLRAGAGPSASQVFASADKSKELKALLTRLGRKG